MKDKKGQILSIINEEINIFSLEIKRYIDHNKFKDAKIAAKALKRLKAMVTRIQFET